MKIDLQPDIESILQQQVELGDFATVEAALAAAVRLAFSGRTLPGEVDPAEDLSWAKPYLAEADADIAAGRLLTETEAYADLERRYGKL